MNPLPQLKIQVRGAERITALAYDPSLGAMLVLDGISGAVYRVSPKGDVSLFTKSAEGTVGMAFDFRRGKTYFLFGGEVEEPDLANGRSVLRFTTEPEDVIGIAVSKDGSLATLKSNDKLQIWDHSSARLLREFHLGS
jgi:hypothetical protein